MSENQQSKRRAPVTMVASSEPGEWLALSKEDAEASLQRTTPEVIEGLAGFEDDLGRMRTENAMHGAAYLAKDGFVVPVLVTFDELIKRRNRLDALRAAMLAISCVTVAVAAVIVLFEVGGVVEMAARVAAVPALWLIVFIEMLWKRI